DAESLRPKGLLEWRLDGPARRQLAVDAISVGDAAQLKRQRKTLWRLITLRRDVGAHQHLIADSQARVHHLVLPVGRNLIGVRRTRVTAHPAQGSAETRLIETQ